jgi:hypothetical protein
MKPDAEAYRVAQQERKLDPLSISKTTFLRRL